MVYHLSIAHGQTLVLDAPRPIGILNITPDSFSDGGTLYNKSSGLNTSALHHQLTQWATICPVVDIGGESTRPGATPVSPEEELIRILPAIHYIGTHFPHLYISVDTRNASVAEQAIMAGAHLINDVSGGLYDKNMFKVIANTGAGYVLMHSQGTPQTMQNNPTYSNVVNEIIEFFQSQISALLQAGVSREQIMIDPGFGFGKTVEHNLCLLNQLNTLNTLNTPILVGLSRKSFLTLGHTQLIPPHQRDDLTAIAHALAYHQGALLFRTHTPVQTDNQLKLLAQLKPLD